MPRLKDSTTAYLADAYLALERGGVTVSVDAAGRRVR
jgi:hypothetical protein